MAFQSKPSHCPKTSRFFGSVNGGILPDNNHASTTSRNLEIPALLYFLVFYHDTWQVPVYNTFLKGKNPVNFYAVQHSQARQLSK
jgi:hypothetical protein